MCKQGDNSAMLSGRILSSPFFVLPVEKDKLLHFVGHVEKSMTFKDTVLLKSKLTLKPWTSRLAHHVSKHKCFEFPDVRIES